MWVRDSRLVTDALGVQASLWHSLLIGGAPLGGEGPARAAALAVARRFVPIILVVAVAAVVLYVTLGEFSLTARVWSIALSVAAALGITGASLASGARMVVGEVAWEVRSAAQVDARVGSITWLPQVPLSLAERRGLARTGVGILPRIKRNIDYWSGPAPRPASSQGLRTTPAIVDAAAPAAGFVSPCPPPSPAAP